MTSYRNSYLISKSIKAYLLATILASFAITLGVVVDGIIVGNFVGSTALVAVNLCVPLIQLMSAITMLINVGGAMMVATSFGKLDFKNGHIFFTMSVFITGVISVLFLIIGIFFCDEVVAILCEVVELRPLVKEYAQVVLLSAPLYLMVPGLCMFIRTDSNPKLASLVLITANVINLIFDLIFINIFNLGVFGSALATSFGYVIGFFIAISHFRNKNCGLSISLNFAFGKVGEILMAGLPVALASALMTVRFLFVNRIILNTLGSEGMSIMAVCFNMMMLSSMFVGGTSQALQPVGGILYGGKDYEGLKIAVKIAFKVLIICILAISIILMIFPNLCAELFGVSGIHNIESTIRIFALSIPVFAINYFIMVNYQIIRIKTLSIAISCGQALMVVPVIYVFSKIDKNLMWYAFVVGESIVLLTAFIFAEIYRRKDKTLDILTLLPKPLANIYSFSLRADILNKEAGKIEIENFLEQIDLKKENVDKIRYICAVYLDMLKTYGYVNFKHSYIDIIIQNLSDTVLIVIKDDGKSLNEVKIKAERILDSISIKKECKSFNYAYIGSQNIANIEIDSFD